MNINSRNSELSHIKSIATIQSNHALPFSSATIIPLIEAAYPQPDSQKTGVGFPIARVVGIISLAVGSLLDVAIGRYAGKKTGEHALLRQLLANFKQGDIVIGDAYYPSFFLVSALQKMKVDVLFPQHNARKTDVRRGRRLGKKDHIVAWKKPERPEWMSLSEYATHPKSINMRESAIHYSRQGMSTKTMRVVTTLVDAKAISKTDLSSLYASRWLIEVDFRAIKTVMKMDILRGKTPAIVRKEIWRHLLAYNLIRSVMVKAAKVKNGNPRELSFKLALQFILAFKLSGLLDNEQNHEIFISSITKKKVGNRPGRSEPRRIKRRGKAFPKMQKSRNEYKKVA